MTSEPQTVPDGYSVEVGASDRKCSNCNFYDPKIFYRSDDDSGKCFLHRPAYYVDGRGACPAWLADTGALTDEQ